MRKYAMSMTALTFLLPVFGFGQGSMGLQEKISAALQGKHRTEAELARDADRAPMAALDFIGLKDDMTVIEFLPAAQAYYTKILGPVLVENGHLWTVDNSNTFSGWGEWTTEPEFEMTHQVAIDNNYSRAEGRYVPGEINFGVSEADLFLHFGNIIILMSKTTCV
jgi:predicted methyltransferase